MARPKKPINYHRGRPKLSVPQRPVPRGDTPTNQHTSTDSATPSAKTVHINIHLGSLPKITWPSHEKLLTTVRQFIVSKKFIIIIAIIGLGVVGLSIHNHDSVTNSRASNQNSVVENLEYQTVLPSGKSIDSLGGWKRVSPAGADPVYAYIDSINGIPISVSQQPLPNSFKDNVDNQVADLAKKFNATTKLDASGTSVYLGTSAKGPQSVILTKNGLLILIKSQEKIDDSAWTDYAKSLN
jgi:hypothetical protein